MARSALHDVHHIELVYLGLDETLFSPLDKKLTRKILGITDDRLVILGGSVNVSDRRKGGHIFEKIVETFSDEALFVVFGAQSSGLRGVKATGLLRDSRKMALLYNAADIFLGTALEEAFGQTLCEAAACSVPIVAFNVGGVPEVARHDVNARLADTISADAIMNELRYLKESPDVRAKLGRAGRALVESEFTLKRQGERWMEYLMSVTDPGRPET
jgi:glycosyltransferase involved in cell wall biosynthesis